MMLLHLASVFALSAFLCLAHIPYIEVTAKAHEGQARSISNRVRVQSLVQNVESEHPAITKLREYLRINTGPPVPDYETAIEWIRKQSISYFGIEFNLVRFKAPDLFALWLTWKGTKPSFKSILLNSHMDVVEADKKKWIHDPFAAYKDPQGNIYGRGSRDMKATTIGQLEAIRQLQQDGFKPIRTVHVSIMPDEENGGEHGMKPFVQSPEFQALNVGFDLDESISGTLNDGRLTFLVPYAQKSCWQFNITAEGVSGHASSIAPNGTAGQKLNHVINRLLDLKAYEVQKLEQTGIQDSDITSINLVRLGGGIGNNILPGSMWAVFDMRIRVHYEDPKSWNFTHYEQFLDTICDEAGPGVSYTFLQKGLFFEDTSMDPSKNVWWATLKDTCDKMNWTCNPWLSSPTSDAGYVRNLGIPALGLVPRRDRSELGPMHGDNEGINEQDFIDSLDRYKVILQNLTMVAESDFDLPE